MNKTVCCGIEDEKLGLDKEIFIDVEHDSIVVLGSNIVDATEYFKNYGKGIIKIEYLGIAYH